MKKILIFVSIMTLITACNVSKKNSGKYGVRYILGDDQWLTIKLYDDTDEIYFLNIVSEFNEYTVAKMNELKVGSLNDDKEKSCAIYHYSFKDNNKLDEFILLNWSLEEFDFDNYKKLIEYIGLSQELSDGILTLDELRNSGNFKYKYFFDEGEYYNNISLANDKRYDVPY